jgi:hypothetical protein
LQLSFRRRRRRLGLVSALGGSGHFRQRSVLALAELLRRRFVQSTRVGHRSGSGVLRGLRGVVHSRLHRLHVFVNQPSTFSRRCGKVGVALVCDGGDTLVAHWKV